MDKTCIACVKIKIAVIQEQQYVSVRREAAMLTIKLIKSIGSTLDTRLQTSEQHMIIKYHHNYYSHQPLYHHFLAQDYSLFGPNAPIEHESFGQKLRQQQHHAPKHHYQNSWYFACYLK